MDEFERQWIELITKAYPNLHNSKVVMHTSKVSDKKIDRIAKYFERLDIIHNKVADSKRKSDELFLKELYYNLYIIKEENIPESYYQLQAKIARERGFGDIDITDEIRHNYATQIIEDQKASLDKWIEYFLYDEESVSYGMWEKYWVFQGIVNLGKYDKETGKFKKRDLSTITSFPDLDREAIFTTLKLMEEYVKDKKSNEEIKSALGNGNFKTLYEYSIKQILNKGEKQNNGTDGIWVKYDQGSDYHKLRDSLQGYYTGWCTAAGENFAMTQIEGGDFYVYYSKDENREAKIPRLAIRMNGHNKIGEIRGIADNQNIEGEMLPILEEKLKEFPDRDKYYKKESDMKKLTEIDYKVHNNIDLTVEELKFLYEIEEKIVGFGYRKDPRIKEIKSNRNAKKDYSKIYNVSEDKISVTQEEYFNSPEKYKIFIGKMCIHRSPVKGLKLPEIISGNLDLNVLETAEGLKLPKIVGGDLELNYIETAEGLELPEIIGGDLGLRELTTTEGLKLPEIIGGYLDLTSISSAEDLKLPEKVGGYLDLSSLEITENLKLPKIVGGDLDLSNLTTAEGLELPEKVGKDLDLSSLTTAEDLELPEKVGRDLDLSSLTTTEGLKLPEKVERDLNLSSITTAEGLKLPKKVGRDLDLSSLTTAEGLKLPEKIGRDLDLSSLTTAEGLKLPKNFDLNNLYCSEEIEEEIWNNPELYYQTDEQEIQTQYKTI